MPPIITSLLTALTSAASAAASNVATEAIKDAYAAVKRFIRDRYEAASPSLDALEKEPGSEFEQQVLAKRLEDKKAGQDPDLATLTNALLEALENLAVDARDAALIDVERIRSQRIDIDNIELTSPTLVRSKEVTANEVRISGIRQTSPDTSGKK